MTNAAAVHQAMFDAIRARDYDGLRNLCDADYVYTGADGVEQKGADAGVAVAEMYLTAFPDVSLEITEQWAPSDDVSIIEFVARGSHTGPLGDIPPTGKPVEVHVCNVIEARDGKVVREREYFDSLSMLQQLGVIPAE